MDDNLYKILFNKGDEAQELFIEFMESCLDCEFVAGDRNGETVNVDFIEEVLNCDYISPNSLGYRHGPKLAFFGNKNVAYTMPDELLMFHITGEHRFIDVKNRTPKTLSEKKIKISDYAQIDRISGIKTYVAVVIYNKKENGYDIYIRRSKDVLRESVEKGLDLYFDLSKFTKLNKYTIVKGGD